MKTIGAEKLQERGLSLLDELEPEGVVITRDGKPVAKLVPLKEQGPAALIGSLRGRVRIRGDILSTDERWDAES